jgi:hypothetical protein
LHVRSAVKAAAGVVVAADHIAEPSDDTLSQLGL